MVRYWQGWLIASCLVMWWCIADAALPNIVLIVADDAGYETVGAYGSIDYETPTLDALAQTGTLFQHAYALPLCRPSRVQILTGQYTFRPATKKGGKKTQVATLASVMGQAGYRSFFVGKWQLRPSAGKRLPLRGLMRTQYRMNTTTSRPLSMRMAARSAILVPM